MVFTIVSFAFKKHERSEFIVAFGGFGGLPPEQDHGVGIYHGSEKVPSVYPCFMLFKICFFLPFLRHLLKIAPDVTK